MRIVFWNTNKNENINEYISDIIVEQEIDILVLAEYESDIEELKKMLALYNIVIEQAITIGCDRITILKRKENIQPAFQNKYCSMQIIDDMYLFRILSNKLCFLDKEGTIPLGKSFIIIWQMLRICRPLAFSGGSGPFTKEFTGKRINTNNS